VSIGAFQEKMLHIVNIGFTNFTPRDKEHAPFLKVVLSGNSILHDFPTEAGNSGRDKRFPKVRDPMNRLTVVVEFVSIFEGELPLRGQGPNKMVN